MLQILDLECVRGDLLLFTGLNFALESGELLHVKGANGSGKTTLLRTVCGLSHPESGEVIWQGEAIRKQGERYRDELTYIGHLNGVKDELTVLENLRIATMLSGEHHSEDQLIDALVKIGLGERIDLPAKALSQGQRRRVSLARLLLSESKLWVLDEPYTALDVSVIATLQQVIAQHLQGGGVVLLTTHQDVDIEGVVKQLTLSA
ncbi:MAG: cytochrome c biogenesis heme-transporting ATPase CcmA [Gammaproteobacteria bacterium]|nr:cytochrome c biogenesis heme-transporting ATPase CcmA [Gammaproteobacteria bacterium]MCF6229251.1 cytochrome c biogenesis heme-transporting ATPase CcmA [Gammaproteobacteria bacterium]